MPLTGEKAEKLNLTAVGTIVTVAVLAAALVGGYYVYKMIDDRGEE